MAPAEKALYLFNKMNGFRISHAHRIKCAKVVCDEMLEGYKWSEETDSVEKELFTFWNVVKIELDKLAKK